MYLLRVLTDLCVQNINISANAALYHVHVHKKCRLKKLNKFLKSLKVCDSRQFLEGLTESLSRRVKAFKL